MTVTLSRKMYGSLRCLSMPETIQRQTSTVAPGILECCDLSDDELQKLRRVLKSSEECEIRNQPHRICAPSSQGRNSLCETA
jgi:hypothetical protein